MAPDQSRWSALRSLFAPIFAQRLVVSAIVTCSLASSLIALSQPLIVAQLIDRVGRGEDLGALPTGLAVLLVVGGVVGGLNQYMIQRAAEGSIRATRNSLAAHILSLPIAEFDRRRSADLISRVNNDTTVVRNMLSQGLVEAVAGVITLVGAAVAMALIDSLMLAVAVAVSFVAVFAVVTVTSRLEGASLELQASVGRLAAALDRAIRSVRTIRAANATDFETHRVAEDVDDAWRVGLRVAKITGLIAPISSVATQAAFLAVLGLGGLRVAQGQISVAQLVSFILYLFLLIMPMGQLFGTISAIGEALGGMARIREIVGIEPEVGISDTQGSRPGGRGAIGVSFRDVSFSYPTTADDVTLDAVSFNAGAGQRIAIVGPSGAGKSTLLQLIARFYDPTSGSILLDGSDVSTQSRWASRDSIAYVEQDAPALAGTIRENLTVGRSDYSDQELVQVLEEMNLRQVVERSPKGLDAEVGESGVLLSGGERQRMAVARALLQRPRLLMLDESTSNLDGLNEESVYRSVARAASDCTVMVVAHRLATVRDCDQILVLSDGRVVGSGTHDELLDTSSLYRRLVRTQLDPRDASAMRNGNDRTAGHAAVKMSGRSDSPGATTTG